MSTRGTDIFLSCLLVALLAASAAADNGDTIKKISNIKASSRIFNGEVIQIEEVPYLVQLRNKKIHFCGGTLISLQHVLTAAHCVDTYWIDTTVVVAGASLASDTGVERKISNVFIHPDFVYEYMHYDAAIVKVDTPFEESNTIRVLSTFCSVAPPVGHYVQVAGWGAMEMRTNREPTTKGSKELRKIRQAIISNAECYDKLRGTRDLLMPNNICAFTETYDSCEGDSGGPVTYGGQVCGIISWGVGCGYDGYPSVYTGVHAILPFIHDTLKL